VTVTSVIELGEVRRGGELSVAEPARSPLRWRFSWLLAGLAVLAATLGPALPEQVPLAEATIPAQLGDAAFAAGEQFYVVTSDRTTLPRPRTITAYTLPGAARLWQAPLQLAGALHGLGTVGGQLLISTQPELQEQVETVSIREATGQIMWRRRALFQGVTPRGDVLLWTSLDGTPSANTGDEVLEAVDPVSGTARWRYQVPAGGWLNYRYADETPTHIVTLLASGRVEVRGVDDARVLAAADLLPPRPPSTPASYVQFALDMMLVREGPTVIAYGLDLQRRWSAPIDLAIEYVTPGCGEMLCVVAHRGGVRLIDPHTGRTLWADPTRESISRAGDYLVGEVHGRDGLTNLTVLDPATGRERARLGPWTVIAPPADDGQLIAMRTDLTTSRAWLARIDPATGSARYIGVVRGVTGDCEVRSGAVICRLLNASVGVWSPIPLP